jgi:hypothetical protein
MLRSIINPSARRLARPRAAWWLAALATASIAGRAANASGQERAGTQTRASLRVQAPESCASAADIAAAVRARSARVAFADDAPLVLDVTLLRDARRAIAAELRVAWPDGRRSARALTAASCAEAADALALLIALTLDGPGENAAPVAAPAAEPAAGATTAGTSTAREPANSDAAAAEHAASAHPTPPAAAPEPATPPPPQGHAEHAARGEHAGVFAFEHAGVGASARAVFGVAPNAMPGVALTAEIAWRGAGWFAPLLRLSAGRSWASADTPDGHAAFRLDAAHLAACVAGLRRGGFAARACASTALGRLRASGSDTYEPHTRARAWAGVGAELLLALDLAGPLQLEAGAGLTAPLRRDRFAFAPAVFHRVAALCGEGQLGLSLRFP